MGNEDNRKVRVLERNKSKTGLPRHRLDMTCSEPHFAPSLARHNTTRHHDPHRLYHGITCSRNFFFERSDSHPAQQPLLVVPGVAPPPTGSTVCPNSKATRSPVAAPSFDGPSHGVASALAFKVMARNHTTVYGMPSWQLVVRLFGPARAGGVRHPAAGTAPRPELGTGTARYFLSPRGGPTLLHLHLHRMCRRWRMPLSHFSVLRDAL
jgi:hypothetical protein